jgi:uncharacterized membrane protein YeaQ/YmgE (transglycosylase-associated protein family)
MIDSHGPIQRVILIGWTDRMNLIAWIVFGLIAGVVAKFVMPGADPGGLIVTVLVGVVGAVVGGYLGRWLFGVGVTGFNLPSLIVAIGGAVLLLVADRILR